MLLEKRAGLRLSPTASASLWYTAANVISKIAAFLLTPIFTRLLSAEEYGLYFLYTSWLSVFTAIFPLDLSGSVTYRALAKFDDQKELLSSALGLLLAATAVFFGIYIPLSEPINKLTSLSTPLTVLLIGEVLLGSLTGLFLAEKRYRCEYKSAAAISVSLGAFSPILSIFLIRFFGFRSEGRIIGSFAVEFLIAAIAAVSIIRGGKRLYSPRVWTYLIKICSPMLLYHFARSIGLQGERLMISALLGEGALAKYSVAHSLGYAVNFISSGISLSVTPWLMKTLDRGDLKKARGALEDSAFTVTLLSVGFLAAAPEIFSFIAPREYSDALVAVYPIALSAACGFLSSVFGAVMLYFEKPLSLGVSTLFSSVLSLFLGYFLIGGLGISGGGIGALLSSLLSLTFNFILVHRFVPQRLFGVRRILSTLAVGIFFSLSLLFLRDFYPSRIIMLLAIFMTALIPLKRTARLVLIKQ